MISVKKLFLKILEQFNYDYVTEKGTENGWFYQKWHSGKRECWTTVDHTGTASTAWGNLYRSGNITVNNFPTDLFSSVPQTTVDAECDDSSYQSKGCKARVVPTATNFGAVWLFRTVSTTSSHTYHLYLHAWED